MSEQFIPQVDVDPHKDLLWRTQHGGRRQRAAAQSELESFGSQPAPAHVHTPTDGDSELCKLLVKQWAWGEISAAGLQRIAHAAYTDEVAMLASLGKPPATSGSLHQFARLGNYGRISGNVARDLQALLGEPDMPPVHYERIPTVIPKPKALQHPVQWVKQAFLLPHTICSHMYHNNKAKFNNVFLGAGSTYLVANRSLFKAFGSMSYNCETPGFSTIQWPRGEIGNTEPSP